MPGKLSPAFLQCCNFSLLLVAAVHHMQAFTGMRLAGAHSCDHGVWLGPSGSINCYQCIRTKAGELQGSHVACVAAGVTTGLLGTADTKTQMRGNAS